MTGINWGNHMIVREFGKRGKPDTQRYFVKDPKGTFQDSDGMIWRETTEPNQPNNLGKADEPK